MTVKDIDKVEKSIRRELKKFKKSHVEVGIRDVINNQGESILQYATVNEFGRPKAPGQPYIPPRSFIRSTVDEKKDEWFGLVQNQIDDILDLKAPSANVALSRLGLFAEGDIKDKISSNIKPDNADSTKIAKAGSTSAVTRTLIDTGAMRTAVKYRVVGL